MTTINSNISALVANNAIKQNDRAMSSAIEKLATGSRISSARDDAAGLGISIRMASQISALKMAAKNANDAISMLHTVEGATKEIMSMLGRMRELAVQAASSTYSDTDRTALDLEFGSLMEEIDRVATNTKWNGTAILAGNGSVQTAAELVNSKTIVLGAEASQSINLSLKSWRTKVAVDSNMTTAAGADRNGVDPVDKFIVDFNDSLIGSALGWKTTTIAGLTFTTANVYGHMLAGAFMNLADGDDGSANNNFVMTASGRLTGFSTSALGNVNNSKVVFTATTAGTAMPTITGDGTGTVTGGGGQGLYYDASGGIPNNSAFNEGVLFYGTTPTRIDITAAANASLAITEIDAAINGGSAERAKYGSYMALLQHASNNLNNAATNASASLSQIADTDYALATTELARAQIISQASTAMLAQANQSKQTVLELLR